MTTTCATCDHMGLKAYPEFVREGIGRCLREPMATFVRLDKPACGKYVVAKNVAEREAWMAKRKEREANANSGN